eukprot:Amastigsp_a841547_218.p2 type:complete len:126 gc:universal Amastigsp_a841547_218:754-377(-)
MRLRPRPQGHKPHREPCPQGRSGRAARAPRLGRGLCCRVQERLQPARDRLWARGDRRKARARGRRCHCSRRRRQVQDGRGVLGRGADGVRKLGPRRRRGALRQVRAGACGQPRRERRDDRGGAQL